MKKFVKFEFSIYDSGTLRKWMFVTSWG